MQKVVLAAEMRDIDRSTVERFGVPSLLLMEQAAASARRVLTKHFGGTLANRHVRIFCGTGNNGGDGAALARLLWLDGATVEVFLIGLLADAVGDARTNFEIMSRLAVPSGENISTRISLTECPTEADWDSIEPRLLATLTSDLVLVDALFGTGLTRPITGVHARVVDHINKTRRARTEDVAHRFPLILSLDLPSGLIADSALPTTTAVRADMTVTFTAPKFANVMPPASRHNGRLVVCPVGSPPELVDEAESQTYVVEHRDAQVWLRRTRYGAGSYKNTHGHVLVVAGSRDMSGAPVLCGNAAFAAGAGLVTLATPHSAYASVAARVKPEVMVAALSEDAEAGSVNLDAVGRIRELAARATVVAIGPGLTAVSDSTRSLVREIVATRKTPVVLDADALNALAPWDDRLRGTPEAPLILTPHEGEMRRLLGSDDKAALDDRLGVARRFAVEYGIYLVLKGERSLVAAPDGRVAINPTGNPGLGTAGAGDTLTGIIASFIAQDRASRAAEEADTFASIVAALYTGGIAGDVAAERNGVRTMTASDIADALGEAVRRIDPAGEQP